MNIKIVFSPEIWSDGYYLPQHDNGVGSLAIRKDSDFNPKPLNSVIFFDRTGQEILHYSKVHTCAFDLEKVLESGEGYDTADLDFGRGTVKIGSMICFDREFPESARILMLKGAELILAPNACPMEINRLSALRTRAYENMVAVATCNYLEGHPEKWNKTCSGRCLMNPFIYFVLDGMLRTTDKGRPFRYHRVEKRLVHP